MELLTVDDLARRWGTGKGFVYHLSCAGKIRKLKLGNLVRFRLCDVEEFERENTIEPLAGEGLF